jgi:hypothetical protein
LRRANKGEELVGFISLGLSIASGFFMLIALIPFLGWLNWITTLPLAIAGAILGLLSAARDKNIFGIAGLIIGIIVIFIGSGRLFIGCGIF